MPQGDRTGPRGEGPLTGRGLGPCNKKETLGEPIEFSEINLRRGLGFRRGLGLGFRRGFGFGRGFGRGR